MGKHSRSCYTSRTKLVRPRISWISMGKTIRNTFGIWMGESPELGMYVRTSGTRIISVSMWRTSKMAGKKQKVTPTWKWWWKCGYWRTHIISWPCVLWMRCYKFAHIVWSSIIRIAVGETVRRGLIRTWIGESIKWRMHVRCMFVHRKQGLFSSFVRWTWHSSTESEVISLDAGLRLDGLFAPDLWGIVIKVLRSTNNNVQPNQNGILETGATLHSKTKTQIVKRKHKVINCLMWIMYTLTHILLMTSLSCVFSKTMRQWSTWCSKVDVQRWETCQEPTE